MKKIIHFRLMVRKWMIPVCYLILVLVSGVQSSAVLALPSETPLRYTLPMTSLVDITEDVLDQYPDVAYNNKYDEYFVVWRREKSIYGRRVTGRGEVIGSELLISPSVTYMPGPPKVAYDSVRNRYLVIWAHNTGAYAYQLKGRFIPADGPNPGLTDFRIDDNKLVEPPAYNHNYSLVYAYTQDEYLVVWSHHEGLGIPSKIAGRQINGEGGFFAGSFVVMAHSTDYRQFPDVAYNLARNEYMVTCSDYPKVNDNVFGVRLFYHANGSLLKGTEFSVANWPDEEGWPAVAACRTANQYLFAWHSLSASDSNIDGIYARDVNGDGSLGDFVKAIMYDPLYGRVYRRVDVACGKTNLTPDNPGYLVAWAENPTSVDDIFAREILPNGLMSEKIDISAGGSWVSVAGGAMNYMVVIDSIGIKARIIGNTRPRAAFSVDPTEGTENTVFQFDASGTSDATDKGESLWYRWDWENDGIYDTAWSHNRSGSHQYSLESWQMIFTFHPQLQVKDSYDARDTTSHQIIVRQADVADYKMFLPLITE